MSSILKPMISLPVTDPLPNLLEFIVQLQDLMARIEALKSETIRLKKLNPKPNVKPNTKPPEDSDPGVPSEPARLHAR